MHLTIHGTPFPLELAQSCVGPGWAGLVEEAYNALPDGSMISQVKEKFGGLRFYASPWVEAIREIEDRSFTICEDCGAPGQPRRNRGWIRTLCDGCA